MKPMSTVFLGIAMVCVATEAFGQSAAGPVNIQRIRTGWASDAFAVESVGGTYLNPANCPVADGYTTEIGAPGYNTYFSIVKMAFALGKPVTLIISVSSCSQSRPQIIGAYIDR